MGADNKLMRKCPFCMKPIAFHSDRKNRRDRVMQHFRYCSPGLSIRDRSCIADQWADDLIEQFEECDACVFLEAISDCNVCGRPLCSDCHQTHICGPLFGVIR